MATINLRSNHITLLHWAILLLLLCKLQWPKSSSYNRYDRLAVPHTSRYLARIRSAPRGPVLVALPQNLFSHDIQLFPGLSWPYAMIYLFVYLNYYKFQIPNPKSQIPNPRSQISKNIRENQHYINPWYCLRHWRSDGPSILVDAACGESRVFYCPLEKNQLVSCPTSWRVL